MRLNCRTKKKSARFLEGRTKMHSKLQCVGPAKRGDGGVQTPKAVHRDVPSKATVLLFPNDGILANMPNSAQTFPCEAI
jgi:hypothetical protein